MNDFLAHSKNRLARLAGDHECNCLYNVDHCCPQRFSDCLSNCTSTIYKGPPITNYTSHIGLGTGLVWVPINAVWFVVNWFLYSLVLGALSSSSQRKRPFFIFRSSLE